MIFLILNDGLIFFILRKQIELYFLI